MLPGRFMVIAVIALLLLFTQLSRIDRVKQQEDMAWEQAMAEYNDPTRLQLKRPGERSNSLICDNKNTIKTNTYIFSASWCCLYATHLASDAPPVICKWPEIAT